MKIFSSWPQIFIWKFWQIFILMILNFSLSVFAKFPNEIVDTPIVTCEQDRIVIKIKTSAANPSHIYAEDFHNVPKCMVKKVNKISIPHGDCGMTSEHMENPAGSMYRICIAVQIHPLFVTDADRSYCAQCVYMESPIVDELEQKISISTSTPSELTPQFDESSNPHCSYSIRKGAVDGLEVHAAVVGETVFHESNVFKFVDKAMTRFRCQLRLCVKNRGAGCETITPPSNCTREEQEDNGDNDEAVMMSTSTMSTYTATMSPSTVTNPLTMMSSPTSSLGSTLSTAGSTMMMDEVDEPRHRISAAPTFHHHPPSSPAPPSAQKNAEPPSFGPGSVGPPGGQGRSPPPNKHQSMMMNAERSNNKQTTMTSAPIIVNNGNIGHLAAAHGAVNSAIKTIGPPSIRPFGLSTAHLVGSNNKFPSPALSLGFQNTARSLAVHGTTIVSNLETSTQKTGSSAKPDNMAQTSSSNHQSGYYRSRRSIIMIYGSGKKHHTKLNPPTGRKASKFIQKRSPTNNLDTHDDGILYKNINHSTEAQATKNSNNQQHFDTIQELDVVGLIRVLPISANSQKPKNRVYVTAKTNFNVTTTKAPEPVVPFSTTVPRNESVVEDKLKKENVLNDKLISKEVTNTETIDPSLTNNSKSMETELNEQIWLNFNDSTFSVNVDENSEDVQEIQNMKIWNREANELNNKTTHSTEASIQTTASTPSSITSRKTLQKSNSIQIPELGKTAPFKRENSDNRLSEISTISTFIDQDEKCMSKITFWTILALLIGLIGFQISAFLLFLIDRIIWGRRLAKRFNRLLGY